MDGMAPDFSVASIEYQNGIVARVTCSIVAPIDKSLTIIGEDGVLEVANVRHDASPVYFRHIPGNGWRAGAERRLNLLREWLEGKMNWRLDALMSTGAICSPGWRLFLVRPAP